MSHPVLTIAYLFGFLIMGLALAAVMIYFIRPAMLASLLNTTAIRALISTKVPVMAEVVLLLVAGVGLGIVCGAWGIVDLKWAGRASWPIGLLFFLLAFGAPIAAYWLLCLPLRIARLLAGVLLFMCLYLWTWIITHPDY